MSEITLNPVRLYTEDDIYEMNTDNRPLVDIMSNINLLNSTLSDLGFYIEAQANPETEPVGGFPINTCVSISNNNLLSPIDISKTAAEIDYTKFPIVLVVDYNATTSTYKCLAFSALYNLSDKFPAFLLTSVGNPVMIGLGGQLVDSFFYDQYYATQTYQKLTVGKIASVNSLTFGGNQVGILGDNFYLNKNRDDSTTGLLTVVRDNQDSNVVLKTVNVDTVGCPYVFGEIQSSFMPEYSLTQLPVPIFFTNSTINYDQTSGLFLDSNLEVKLNELHFASPLLSPTSAQDSIYSSAGVTVGSLTSFTNQYLLHSSDYSTPLSEESQAISTNLVFGFQASTQLTLAAQFPDVTRSIGTAINQATGIPSSLIPSNTTQISGTTFGTYGQLGAFIGTVVDDPTNVTRMSVTDETTLAQTSGFNTVKLSDMTGSSNLLINNFSDDSSVLANIIVSTNGYLILNGDYGVHVCKKPVFDSEIANKIYVDTAVKSISNTSAQFIPLGGSTSTAPITGSLIFDVTANTTSTSQVMQFTSLVSADIASSTPVRFVDSSSTPNSSGLTVVNMYTTASVVSTDPGWNDFEAVNKSYLKSYVNTVISGSPTSPYLTLAGAQNAGGDKTFSGHLTATGAITLNPLNGIISSTCETIHFENLGGSDAVKLMTGSTTDADGDQILTTKDYVDAKTAAASANSNIWASWNTSDYSTGILQNAAPDYPVDSTYSPYFSITSGPNGTQVFVVNTACNLHIKMSAFMISSDYIVQISLLKNNVTIGTTGAGTSSTAAGVSTNYNSMDIDVITSCSIGDTLTFSLVQNYPVKSSGVLTSLSASGYFMVVK